MPALRSATRSTAVNVEYAEQYLQLEICLEGRFASSAASLFAVFEQQTDLPCCPHLHFKAADEVTHETGHILGLRSELLSSEGF